MTHAEILFSVAVSSAVPAAAQGSGSSHSDLRARLDSAVAKLIDPALTDHVVDRAITGFLRRALRTAWERGWQPNDLAELSRRRLDGGAHAYLIGTIADEAEQYAPATVDPRWRDQLVAIGARVWWPADRTQPSAFAQRPESLGRPAVLRAAAYVGGLLIGLGRLPLLLPLPGEATASTNTANGSASGSAGTDVDEKMLARIRALLAKAESTDFPQEAEALSAKAQELMARFSLDQALLADAGPIPGRHGPAATARRLWLDSPYVKAKCMLVGAVAQANGCRSVMHTEIGFSTIIGDPADLQLVELLSTSLLVQAGRAMAGAGSRVDTHGRSRTRSFRQSFILAYAQRIGERLQQAAEASREAMAAETDVGDRLLPVLAAKAERVDSLVEEMFPRLSHSTVTINNAAGWRAGREAADRAQLDTRRALRT